MKVTASTLTMEGADLDGENPLPKFRSRNRHVEVAENGSLSPEQKIGLGYETGERYLPYRMQDRYTRERKRRTIQTIELENEALKAVFLPDYGGRLHSLVDKRTNRDILYRNPVFQPANLAILNAWFSGGAEWNVGQVGHAFTTCSPVHAAKLADDEGNEFLRIYEYERCKNVFWQIDFHLPRRAEQLSAYVRIINDNERPVPMYWWTNIAVEETPRARVFSGTGSVIYIDHHIKGYGAGELPYLPSVPGIDVSYPMGFPFSNEYFFQTRESDLAPWEAVAYEDGRLFYERSTSRLRYRKMFCWGHHSGGRRWCDFLARPGEGDYIEVQGGFAPTQRHGLEMPADTEWDFSQLFGMTKVEQDAVYRENWQEAREYVHNRINGILNEEEVYARHREMRRYARKTPETMLHAGSGWGALERIRREKRGGKSIPDGFLFQEISLGEPQRLWLELLYSGVFPDLDPQDVPASWMVQDEWLTIVQESLEVNRDQSWSAYMHLGVMLYEDGMAESAIEAWEHSLRMKPSPWVYRNLAVAANERGETDQAVAYYESAFRLSNGFPDRAFYEEYLDLLIGRKEYGTAWSLFETLPEAFAASDRIRIMMGAAALALDQDGFMETLFETEFAVIREGETLIVELWHQYQARKLAKSENRELTPELLEEAKAKLPVPRHIDFRIIGEE